MNSAESLDAVTMLTLQRDKYRLIQNAAPALSACWIAAKTTADGMQRVLDWYASVAEQEIDKVWPVTAHSGTMASGAVGVPCKVEEVK